MIHAFRKLLQHFGTPHGGQYSEPRTEKAASLSNSFTYRLNKVVISMEQLSCWFHAPLLTSLLGNQRLPHSHCERKVEKTTYTASAAITASSED